jgi:hypothetical protein
VYRKFKLDWEDLVRVSNVICLSHEFLAVIQCTAVPSMMECNTDVMFTSNIINNIRSFYQASNLWPLSVALDSGRLF